MYSKAVLVRNGIFFIEIPFFRKSKFSKTRHWHSEWISLKSVFLRVLENSRKEKLFEKENFQKQDTNTLLLKSFLKILDDSKLLRWSYREDLYTIRNSIFIDDKEERVNLYIPIE